MTRYVFDKLIKAPGSLVFYSEKLSSTFSFRILVVVDRDFVYVFAFETNFPSTTTTGCPKWMRHLLIITF